MIRLVLDVSLTRQYAGRPSVGIVRVERELAKVMLNRDNSFFVYYDQTDECFRYVPTSFLEKWLDDSYKEEDDSEVVTSIPFGIRFPLRSTDIVINCGLPWDFGFLPAIYKIKKEIKFRFVQIIYDIIPIIYPEYCVPGMVSKFPRFILDTSWTADIVFCISDQTSRDFSEYLDLIDAPNRPRVLRIQLGVDQIQNHNYELDLNIKRSKVIRDLDPIISSTGFVMYVSTVEPRKNHILLLNIWKKLYKELKDLTPTLLFIGKKAWNTNDLIFYVQNSETYHNKKILITENINDSELSWLYENCLFTVYPSVYEGWGLPISESMAHGKVCITSNASSMPEATQNIMPMLEPLDYIGWFDKCYELVTSKDTLINLQNDVIKKRNLYGWRECMEEFLTKLDLSIKSDNLTWLEM